MSIAWKTMIWGVPVIAIAASFAEAAASPLLAWRQPVYIVAGFAGIAAMSMLLVQPLLAGPVLPGLSALRGRRLHRWGGGLLLLLIVVHVAGLWITSPPDVVDALLFRSPTPFSFWGVSAMWAVFFAAVLAVFRRSLPFRIGIWRLGHTALVAAAVVGSVVHALLIEGTMGTVSKVGLSALALAATAKVVTDFRVWAIFSSRNP